MSTHGALCGLAVGLIFGLLWGLWLATLGAAVLPTIFDGVARTIFLWTLGLHCLYGVLLGVTLANTGALAEAKNSAFIGALATGGLTYLGSKPLTALVGAVYGAVFGLACFFLSYSILRRTEGMDFS